MRGRLRGPLRQPPDRHTEGKKGKKVQGKREMKKKQVKYSYKGYQDKHKIRPGISQLITSLRVMI